MLSSAAGTTLRDFIGGDGQSRGGISAGTVCLTAWHRTLNKGCGTGLREVNVGQDPVGVLARAAPQSKQEVEKVYGL